MDWPDDVLWSFVNASYDLDSDKLVLNEPESMLRFADMLDRHVRVFSEARKGLAVFLRERFTVDDLLAVRKPSLRDDRIHSMFRTSDSVRVSYLRWFGEKPVRRFPPDVNEEE